MPRRPYYRAQAELFARLALASRDPQIADRYHRMGLEQLAKAEKLEPDRAPADRLGGREVERGEH